MIHFIKTHLKVALAALSFIALTILAFVLNKRGQKGIEVPAAPDIVTEMKAVKAEANVQKLQAELGADHARAQVEADHAAAIAKLDADQKQQADDLKNDPAKLAAFLVRAGKGTS
jgi:hypothetical protein